MRKIFFVIAVCSFFSTVLFAENGHEIDVHVVGIKDTNIYLAFHFGEKDYVKDTARLDANGNTSFKGKDSLPGGIYMVVMPAMTYSEIIVDDQHFSVTIDPSDFINKTIFKNSKENEIYYDYLREVTALGASLQGANNRLQKLPASSDSISILNTKIKTIDKQQTDIVNKYINSNPQLFLSKLLKATQDPEIPDAPKDKNGKVIDSFFQYHYLKTHYFDNVDFSDARMLRTPIFENRLIHYLDNICSQSPDTLIKEADALVQKSKANDEVYKFVVITLTSKYEQSRVMGHDAVFAFLAKKYYLENKAPWADSAMTAKIADRVAKIQPNEIGRQAPNLIMTDMNGQTRALYDVKSKFTVLYFWDSTCGHCQIETPKLDSVYEKFKQYDVEVYAVNIEQTKDGWKKYVADHHLNWINVDDVSDQNNFRSIYDIYSTPVMYLLDANKKIIAKRIDAEQLTDMLNSFLGLNKKSN
jgi:peroxiredoxin